MIPEGRQARRQQKRAGFALLAVIWGTGLIAMLVVAFMNNGRLRLQAAQNVARATVATYVVESAINLESIALLSKRDAVSVSGRNEPVSNGEPKFCVLDRAAVAVSVEDEGGKIDLNVASPELLTAALVGLGLNENKAGSVASAIVAYRTAPNGAFGQIRPSAGADKPFEPKQAFFETVLELDQVSGIDVELFRTLLPFVTVHSRAPGVDSRASPPALFAALAGFRSEEVRALTAAPYPNSLNRTDARFPANFNQAGDHSAFLVHAEALLDSGQTAARDAILDMRPPDGRQFAFREMRRAQSRHVGRLREIIATNGAGVPDC